VPAPTRPLCAPGPVDISKVKKEQLAVVAWVQDGSSKAVLNAGMSIPTFFIAAQIPEQSTSVKNSFTHYIRCSIKNDNQTKVAMKISIRDSTRNSSYSNTGLSWMVSAASSIEPTPADSIIAFIEAGDSLVFWAITTDPATTNAKAVFELFAENRSDPQELEWGCVRYLNLTTSANGAEYSKPAMTGISRGARAMRSEPSILLLGDLLLCSAPADGRTSISLHTLDGAMAKPLDEGFRQQGVRTFDLRRLKLKSGMYVVRYVLEGKVTKRTVAYLR